jgi:hypothetical protein
MVIQKTRRKRYTERNGPNRAVEWLVGSDIGPWALLGCMPPHTTILPICVHCTVVSSILHGLFSLIMKIVRLHWLAMYACTLPHLGLRSPFSYIHTHWKKQKKQARKEKNSKHKQQKDEKEQKN